MLPETFAADTCSPMFSSFATREDVSVVKQKHILLLGTMLPVWQNLEISGKHVSGAIFSCNVYPPFFQGFRSYV